MRLPFDRRCSQGVPKTKPQNHKVDCQSNDRRRRERSRKLREWNMRKMPDEHVLPIQRQDFELPAAYQHVSDLENHRRGEFLLEVIRPAANGSFACHGRNVIGPIERLGLNVDC
jgi:hypothetical protein